MSFLSLAAHKAIQIYQKKSHDKFVGQLSDLKKVQLEKLFATLNYLKPVLPDKEVVNSYESFVSAFPITSYENYKDFFLKEKTSATRTLPEVVRFQPTSGSTNAVKWIPYTKQLLQDFDSALAPWLYDFYASTPDVLKGPHYWSLSWLPQDLRDEGLRLDDTELFPFWKRVLLKQTMAVVAPVDLAETSESSLFATLAFLLDRESLSFASVWSPTYWLNLVSLLEKHQTTLASSLENGQWAVFAKELEKIPCPHNPARAAEVKKTTSLEKLWPELKKISCWTTSTSTSFAKEIESRWPHIQVLGKGLWATEACVTIPFRGRYTLALNSHFFEFQDIATEAVYPSWDLKVGQIVSPLVTTSGGLIRYKLPDALKVTGFIEQTPTFEFLGRADGVDMVGEKTSSVRASEILLSLVPEYKEAFLFAKKGESSKYIAVVDASIHESEKILSEKLERLLAESFHYRLARELGQLEAAQVVIHKMPMNSYIQLHLQRGMVLGNIKAESLRLITDTELKDHFLCN
jgi:hypothetical protein